MKNRQVLENIVVKLSRSDAWENAVQEWEITDVLEDEDMTAECVCTHPHIKYLYEIQNVHNKNRIFPVGSECIKLFGRHDLIEQVGIHEAMFKLRAAIERKEFITLSSKYFTRKLLQHLEPGFTNNQGI